MNIKEFPVKKNIVSSFDLLELCLRHQYTRGQCFIGLFKSLQKTELKSGRRYILTSEE